MPKIVAVVVTYHPNPDTLFRLVKAILPQVDKILIIDNNTPELAPSKYDFDLEKITWRVNSSNLGVAAAYNQGVVYAENIGATHVILFDQDSYPVEGMIAKMYEVSQEAKSNGIKLAALGPNYVDVKGVGQSPFVKVQGLRLARIASGTNEFVSVDHLISSGCLIDLQALDVIGLFEEKLFIDYIDTEWCLRAKSKGYELYGVCGAYMQHNLGEDFLIIFNKTVPVHSPLRHYYLMRNGIWLICQSWVGWRWRFIDTVRLTKIFIVFCVFGKPRGKHLVSMLKGIKDGVLSKF